MSRREERLNELEEAMRLSLDAFAARLWTSMPAVVTKVDLEKQTVSAQPTIRGRVRKSDGSVESIDMPVCEDVPVLFFRAGNFVMTFPIEEGDECLLFFASRCIDGWWESGGIAEPAERRRHDLSDAFAFFGPTSQPRKVSGVSTANVVLRSLDGETLIELTPGGEVNITTPSKVTVTTPEANIVSETVNVEADTINLKSDNVVIGVATPIVFGTHRHTEPDGFTEGPVPAA